jgi:uncharacterized protein (DUF1499 family)
MTRKVDVRRLAIRFGFLVLLAMAGLFAMSWSSNPPVFPAERGAEHFAPCPDSPNCVSTQATSSEHQMKPLPWTGATDEVVNRIKRAVGDQFARSRLVVDKPNYLRYEVTSLIFRFVDDVEFMIDPETRLVHFRSASRVGHSDLGANRRRMERFVEAFESSP